MNDELSIRRILVALDASPGSLVAAEAGTLLARLLHAELDALFVEDVRILDLSRSPLAREVDFLTSSPRSLESSDVERQLRAQAQRARRNFERVVAGTRVKHSFRVTRGPVPDEVRAAARESDLVALGATGWSLSGRRRLGATARSVLEDAGRLLVLRRGLALDAALAVLHDSDPAASEALELAVRIALAGRLPLRILALGHPDEAARELLVHRLQGREIDAEIQWLGDTEPERLAHRIGRQVAMLFVPLSDHSREQERFYRLLDRLECPFLVVSQGGVER